LKGHYLNTENFEQLKSYLQMATAVVVGPGLGPELETQAAVKEIVNQAANLKKPLVLDADGLKAFAEFQRQPEQAQAHLVLTPHASEFSLLTGKPLPHNVEERIEKTRKTAARLGVTILLKGNIDIVSDGRRIKLNFTGNPGMTVGGTGDVLAGIVGALLAQRVNPFEAAVAASFVNGAAGDFAKSKVGYHMMATDLLEWIPKVIDYPMSHLKVRESAS
jgi:NAD(P)H-hydrate epimerase